METKQMRISTGKTILSIVAAIAIMVAAQLVSELLASIPSALGLPLAVGNIVAGTAYTACGLVLLWLFAEKAIHMQLPDLNIPRIRLKPVWIVISVLLPLTVTVAFLLMPGNWVKGECAAAQVGANVAAALFYIGISAGVVEEALFRGLLMTVMQKRWNTAVAVLIPSVLFALLHVFNAPLSFVSFLQLLVAGTAVGIMFSLIALESGSIWNSALVHAVWNAVIIGRILHIGISADESALVNFVLHTDQFLLTGGDFGIEASLYAIIGYLLVSGIAIVRMRKGNPA